MVYNRIAYDETYRKIGQNSREDWRMVPDSHPAIISWELFDEVSALREAEQAVKEERKKWCRQRRKNNPNIFKGRIFCKGCGEKLVCHWQRQKKGMYLGGYRPFGFLPDPNDCHKLILDPVASQYVRLIFELALQGNKTGAIAKILNEKQIPTPAAYHVAKNHVYSEQKAWDLQRSHWTSGTVYHVLKNEKYKGTYVGAKFIMPVPCKHRVLRAPLEQQVRIEDSHAAIVTPEEFEQAQKVIIEKLRNRVRNDICVFGKFMLQ